ncbi:hypothetical protein mvi_17580 [Methylobacterium indicum]|uniref:Uncharacterized protein n=2 Tax=Methylobacterium indicum TaxID=1775910 RepID=A0A8H9C406_9HYPH|nr:hypothetical protein mvi_17580 [Methylobacterium indicum]
MSTISGASTPQPYAQRLPTSPRGPDNDRMAEAISNDVSSGALGSADATALTSALGAIRSSLSSDRTSSTANADGTNPTGSRRDPASMRSRIDSLIADQVSSGALTSDQASELKTLFASHGRSTTASTAAGRAPDGPPPGPPPGGPGAGGPSDDLSSTATGASSGSSIDETLSQFMQQLQASQNSSASYGANGSRSSTASTGAMLLDFRT